MGQSEIITDVKRAVVQLRPDTVIVEEQDAGVPTELLVLLEISNHPSRIIGFSMNDNRLNVYHREERIAATAADLVQLVTSDY